MNGDDIIIHIKQGDIYKKADNIELAISEYQKALKIHPTNSEALFKLGQAYEIKGNTTKEQEFFLLAQNTYEKATALEPNNPEIHNSIISLGVKQGRIDELVKQYNEKLARNPNSIVLMEMVRKLTTISLVSIPEMDKTKTENGASAKVFLDYIFPFVGIVSLLLGIMIPSLKVLQPLGILMVVAYLIYKFSTAKKSDKYKKW